jgi:cysteine desulfurase/selenocysteine lyase
LDLTDRFCDGLTRLGARLLTQRSDGVKSGIVAFEMPGVDSRWLGGALSREGVVTTYRDAGIRVSPHGYNLPREIDAALETIAALTTSAAAG